MATTIRSTEHKTFELPDEARSFPHGKLDVVNLGETAMGRAVLEPGWKWSESVKPIVHTPSCQESHVGYVLSGRLTAKTDDGATHTFQAGEAMSLQPGHDAWVEGNEPCVLIDFVGFENYAKQTKS